MISDEILYPESLEEEYKSYTSEKILTRLNADLSKLEEEIDYSIGEEKSKKEEMKSKLEHIISVLNRSIE